MKNNISKKFLPSISDVNIGIILLAVFYLIDFGSIAGLYSFLNFKFKIPLISQATSILYAIYLVLTGNLDFDSRLTKLYLFLCTFIIGYAFIITKMPGLQRGTVNLFIFYASVYIISIHSIRTPSQFVLIIDIWLAAIAFSSFHGIIQGGLVWSNKFLTDENEMATVAATAIPFAFLLMVNYKSLLKKIFYATCVGLYVAVNVIAHSRGGSLAMIAAAMQCWLFMKSKIRNLVLIVFAVILVFQFAPPKFFEEMKTLEQGTSEGTAADRIYLWGIGIKMFSDNPVFGIGPNNYVYYFRQYEKGKKYDADYIFRSVHSTVVQWIAELGIFGVILLSSIHYYIYRNWRDCHLIGKQKEFDENMPIFMALNTACVISISCFWVGALFLSLFVYPFLWCLIPYSQICKNIILADGEIE